MANEMGHYYNAMTNDLGGKLNGFVYGLQSRYGDPRVYEMQREQMQQQEARVSHKKAAKTADLLRSAYETQADKNRNTHTTRMKKRSTPQPAASPQ